MKSLFSHSRPVLAVSLGLLSLLTGCQGGESVSSKVTETSQVQKCSLGNSLKDNFFCRFSSDSLDGEFQPVSLLTSSAVAAVNKQAPNLGVNSSTKGYVSRRIAVTQNSGNLKKITQYSVRFFPKSGQEIEVVYNLDGRVTVQNNKPLIVRPFPNGVWGAGNSADPIRGRLGVVSLGLLGTAADVQQFSKVLLGKLKMPLQSDSLSSVSEVSPGVFAFQLKVTPYREVEAINAALEIKPEILQAWPERIGFSVTPGFEAKDEVLSIFNGDVVTIAELEKRARG